MANVGQLWSNFDGVRPTLTMLSEVPMGVSSGTVYLFTNGWVVKAGPLLTDAPGLS